MRSKTNIEKYRKLADDYFAECDSLNREVCENGKNDIVKPYTLSGLLCELGLSREDFFSLRNKRDGRVFVNYAMLKIRTYIEENALLGKLSGNVSAKILQNDFEEHAQMGDSDDVVRISVAPELEKLGG